MPVAHGGATVGGAIFVKYGSIKGTATEAHHKGTDGWWAATDLRFRTTRSIQMDTGRSADRNAGVARLDPVEISFPYGSNVADLWIASTASEGVTCVIERTAVRGDAILRIELENAMISAFDMRSDCGVEYGAGTMSVSYTRMSVTTIRYNEQGKMDTKCTRAYDVGLGHSL